MHDIYWKVIIQLLRNSERLWDQNFHFPVHKIALLFTMSCVTWIQWKSIYVNDLISILMLSSYDSLGDLFSSYFHIKILYAILISSGLKYQDSYEWRSFPQKIIWWNFLHSRHIFCNLHGDVFRNFSQIISN
jgi:hypothetical protein